MIQLHINVWHLSGVVLTSHTHTHIYTHTYIHISIYTYIHRNTHYTYMHTHNPSTCTHTHTLHTHTHTTTCTIHKFSSFSRQPEKFECNVRSTRLVCECVCVSLCVCHTSYIIYHTSCIIHHTTYIIHHTSYIIHHTSYIIHHTSYSSCVEARHATGISSSEHGHTEQWRSAHVCVCADSFQNWHLVCKLTLNILKKVDCCVCVCVITCVTCHKLICQTQAKHTQQNN